MRMAAWLYPLLFLALLVLPEQASAALTAQCTGIDCQLCYLFDLFNNVIQYALLIGASIAAGLFAYAGGLMVFAQGDVAKIAAAKKLFASVVTGYVIALVGVLAVETLVNSLAAGTLSWKRVPCSQNRLLSGGLTFQQPIVVVTQSTGPVSPEGLIIYESTSGQRFTNIAQAAAAFEGRSSYDAPGTNNGDLACAWAVNQVLQSAGVQPVDHLSVPEMEKQLKSGRGTAVDMRFAQPGDLIIRGDTGHVGICKTSGCTEIISNSSSARSFTNKQNPQQFASYKGQTYESRVYRVMQ